MAGLTIDDFKDCVVYASWWARPGSDEGDGPHCSGCILTLLSPCRASTPPGSSCVPASRRAIQLIMGGKMKLEGNLKYIMKHMAAVNALVEVYKSIPLK